MSKDGNSEPGSSEQGGEMHPESDERWMWSLKTYNSYRSAPPTTCTFCAEPSSCIAQWVFNTVFGVVAMIGSMLQMGKLSV